MISASFGVSRKTGKKKRERRMAFGWSLSRQSSTLPQNYAGTRAGARHKPTAKASYRVLNGGATWAQVSAPAGAARELGPGGGVAAPSFTSRKNSLWWGARGVTQGRALTSVYAIRRAQARLLCKGA